MGTKLESLSWLVATILLGIVVLCSDCMGQQAPTSRPDNAALQKLVQALGSNEFEEREEASRKLVDAGEAAREVLQQATSNSDPEIRRRAAACIEKIKRYQTMDRYVLKLQQGKTPEERAKAVGWIGEDFGPEAVRVLPALLHALDDPDINVRLQTMVTIASLGEAARPVMPRILAIADRALDDPDINVRLRTMNTIGRLGEGARPAFPKILAIAENESLDDSLRVGALWSLIGLGSLASETTPSVLKLAKTKNARIAEEAALTLGCIAKNHGDTAVPVLLDLLKHENPRVQGRAAVALGTIGKQPERVVPALIEEFRKSKDRYPVVKKEELRNSKGRYPVVRKEYDVRPSLLGGLEGFGPHAKPIIPLLLPILNEAEKYPERVCMAALGVLGQIGPEAKEAVPTLLRLLQRDKSHLGLDSFVKSALDYI